MKNTTFPPTRPATPEDLLAIFRDQYRFQLEYDPEAEPDYEIEFGLTVRDWTNACDSIRPSELGPALGKEFGIKATWDDWRQVLEPEKERTLRDVCDFISTRGGRIATAESFPIFGCECGTAGAFIAIRSMLKEHGVDVAGLRPSSSVNEFIKNNNWHGALMNIMCHLAPGVLPDAVQRKENGILDHVASYVFLGGMLLILASFLVWAGNSLSVYFGGPTMMEDIPRLVGAIPLALLVIAFVGFVISEKVWPTEHGHPPVETFGDLARAVAAYEPPASSE